MTLIELEMLGPEPVSVAEAKAWARIERDDEDELIATLIAAARQSAERQTGVALRPALYRLSSDGPPEAEIASPVRPLREVRAVLGFSAGGTAEVLPAQGVTLRGTDRLVLDAATQAGSAGGIEIDVAAGISAGEVPADIRLAMLRIVAASFETRGIVEAAQQPALVPALARAMLAPFRTVRL